MHERVGGLYLFMFFKMSLRSTETIKCGCNKSGSYLHRITMRLLYREKMLHPDVCGGGGGGRYPDRDARAGDESASWG